MLPELERLVDALEARRHGLLDRLRPLTREQLEFRPRADVWCLLQVARHLLMAEEAGLRYRPDPDAAGRAVRPGWRDRIGRIAVRIVLATGIRVRVPAKGLTPEPTPPLAETEERWTEVGARLRERVAGLTEREARAAFIRHPVSGPLNAEDGLRFYVRHFDHHMRQVRRIMRAPGYPGSTPTSGA